VRGAAIASELGISMRTLYRDIASLQAQGAAIEGEPGVGLCAASRLRARQRGRAGAAPIPRRSARICHPEAKPRDLLLE